MSERSIDSEKVTEAKAGNDVYLSIDADLQIAAYNILEEKLAAILLSKMVNRLDYDTSNVTDADSIVIPVGDVYNAFFKNEIIDTSQFTQSDAGTAEKEVLETYSRREEDAISSVLSEMQNANGTAYQDLSDRMKATWTMWWTHF